MGVTPGALAVLPALVVGVPEVGVPEPETVVDEVPDFEELPQAAASSPNVTMQVSTFNHACFIAFPPLRTIRTLSQHPHRPATWPYLTPPRSFSERSPEKVDKRRPSCQAAPEA